MSQISRTAKSALKSNFLGKLGQVAKNNLGKLLFTAFHHVIASLKRTKTLVLIKPRSYLYLPLTYTYKNIRKNANRSLFHHQMDYRNTLAKVCLVSQGYTRLTYLYPFNHKSLQEAGDDVPRSLRSPGSTPLQ